MFTLYTTALSANGRKVLALCRHLGLEPDVKWVDVYKGEGRSPEYLAINPAGKVPTLVEAGFTLTESNAILQYIADEHGGGRLLSRTPRGRAAIARWMFWEASDWQPALVEILTPFVAVELGLAPGASPPRVRWDDGAFQRVAHLLDDHLRGRRFLEGEELTIADLSVAAMLMYTGKASFPADVFANIARWYAAIAALDGWRDTAVAPWIA